ncbi:hypothetical protein OSTOST_04201, partial [Ostertagia ostertagi]
MLLAVQEEHFLSSLCGGTNCLNAAPMSDRSEIDRFGISQWTDQIHLDGLSECAIALRNQLASLPSNNAMEFLENVRRVAREIDVEANAVSEELAIIEESYPQILANLRSFKRDLLMLKEETCTLRNQYEDFVRTFMDLMRKNSPALIPQLQALSRKQILLQRLKWANQGKELLSLCRAEMKSNHCEWPRLCELFQSACKHTEGRVELTDNSYSTFVDGLKSLAPELNEFARKGLNQVLLAIKYPFEDSIDTQAYASEITTIASMLSLIYLITEYLQKGTGCEEVYRVFLDPIGVRFAFHFYGDRKTNDIWKPQWYLSQTLNWIQVNLNFFVTAVGIVAKQLGISMSPASTFYKYLSELPIVKTKTLLKQEIVLNDVLLFSHLLDECISYETQLREMDPDGYSSSILTLFCNQEVLNRWIEIENECCLDRMDEMLSAPDRWRNRFRSLEEADQYLVCNCADAFVSMLQSQQNRAKLLPDDVAQRKFLNLQLLLTDDFRKRLVQIANQAESPWSEPFPNVMNAMWYLRQVVEDWSDSCLLSGVTSTGGRAVFEESSAMFKHVWNQMADDVVTSLRLQTIDVMKPYQQHFWCVMEPRLGSSSRDLTSLFCPVLMKIRTTFANAAYEKDQITNTQQSAPLASVITEEIVDTSHHSVLKGLHRCCSILNTVSFPAPVTFQLDVILAGTIIVYKKVWFNTLLGSLKFLSLSWAVITLLREEIGQV